MGVLDSKKWIYSEFQMPGCWNIHWINCLNLCTYFSWDLKITSHFQLCQMETNSQRSCLNYFLLLAFSFQDIFPSIEMFAVQIWNRLETKNYSFSLVPTFGILILLFRLASMPWKKNERPYDFNLRQNTPMGVTRHGRDLKNFKSRTLQVQWLQILSEIAFKILLFVWDITIY